MTGAGRPLRFVALLMGGWVATRLVWVWPASAVVGTPAMLPAPIAAAGAALVRVAVPPAIGGQAGARVRLALAPQPPRVSIALSPAVARRSAARGEFSGTPVVRTVILSNAVAERFEQAAMMAMIGLGSLALPASVTAASQGTAAGNPAPPARGSNRLSASAWVLARSGDAPPTLASVGQLGGSQFGVRLVYRIAGSQDRPVSLFGRLSGPLSTRGKEASVGIEAQPFDLPVRLVAERRIALEKGAASGFAVSAVGGGTVALPRGLQLDAYGQAGVVGLKRRDLFVDGAAVVTGEAARLGAIPVRVGAGVWGGAQPGVSRLDVGPRIEAGLPVAGQTFRVGLDWRERVAGNAMPGSGPAITVGADF